MFEKEAKVYADKVYGNRTEIDHYGIADAFQDGAEFGYNKAFVEADKNLKAVVADFNKANEWHYVKDGNHPTDGKDVEVLYQDCDKINVYNCVYDIHAENWLYYNLDDMILEPFPYNVIAWKEIVLPKLKEIKENERYV